MAMVVRAYPMQNIDEFLRFRDTLVNERSAETDSFYRRHGARHESWHLQDINGSKWLICCTDVTDRGAAGESYSASEHEFDVWFKEQVLRLSGVDPNKTPFGLPSEQVFYWESKAPGAP
jgi:hypothetical protein